MKLIHFSDRQCDRIRRYLDSYVDNELSVETNHEVLHHLESCADCSAVVEHQAMTKRRLQAAVQRTPVPDRLPQDIRAAVRSRAERPFGQPHWAGALVLAATLVIGIAGIATWRSANVAQIQQVLHLGVDDHVHCALEERMGERTTTVGQIASALGPQYAPVIDAVQATAPDDCDLVSGHFCRTGGRSYVHFILRDSGQNLISVVLTERGKDELPEGVERLHSASLGGFEVSGFETANHLAFVVSNLNGTANAEIARNLQTSIQIWGQ